MTESHLRESDQAASATYTRETRGNKGSTNEAIATLEEVGSGLELGLVLIHRGKLRLAADAHDCARADQERPREILAAAVETGRTLLRRPSKKTEARDNFSS